MLNKDGRSEISLTELKEQKRLSMAEMVHIMQLVCSRMQELHDDGSLYLQCMPENISACLDQDGGVEKIKLFGTGEAMKISAVHSDYKYDPKMDGWASLEQMNEEKRLIDVQADIFSAGALFLWLATDKKLLVEKKPGGDRDISGFIWQEAAERFSEYEKEIVDLIRRILTETLNNAANERYIHIARLAKDFKRLEKRLNELEGADDGKRYFVESIHSMDYPNGNHYEGELLDGKLNGKGKLTYVSGDVYEGEFQDDKLTGKGKLTWKNGDVYEGEWLDGKRTGRGKMSYANGNVYEEEWLDGQRISCRKLSGAESVRDLFIPEFLRKHPKDEATKRVDQREALAEREAGLACDEKGLLTEALVHYKKAADLGDARAAFYVGTAYHLGRGVQKNLKSAIEWYTRAAKKGIREAQYILGGFYYNGKAVEKDYKLAYEYFMMAAKQGMPNSMAAIGHMYKFGDYVSRDYKMALMYYRDAADLGFSEAEKYYKELDEETRRA